MLLKNSLTDECSLIIIKKLPKVLKDGTTYKLKPLTDINGKKALPISTNPLISMVCLWIYPKLKILKELIV
jgi:hypothetical protein